MTDAAKASVWDVVWSPWGSAYTISGTATLDARFPGQWYQLAALRSPERLPARA